MQFLLLLKAEPDTGASAHAAEEFRRDMNRFDRALLFAGVLVAADRLHERPRGASVRFSGGKPTTADATDGSDGAPIAGYWIVEARSKEEAVEWARRIPVRDGEVEIRQILDAANP
jgi:hypothetical protein